MFALKHVFKAWVSNHFALILVKNPGYNFGILGEKLNKTKAKSAFSELE